LHDPRGQAVNKQTDTQATWPAVYQRSDVCNPAHANTTNWTDGKVHTLTNPANGIYCSDKEIDLSANNYPGPGEPNEGTITLVAPIITVTGNAFVLHGYYQDPAGLLPPLTLWQGGSASDSMDTGPVLTLGVGTGGANNSAFNDTIWVSNGDLLYNGNSATTGFYEAWNILINGNSFQMLGNGPPLGGTPQVSTITTPTSTLMTTSTVYTTLPSTIYSTSTGTTTSPNTTSTSYSTVTVTAPDTTSTSASTNTIIIPGTSGNTSTTVKTTGTNLAINQ
jgi:hypothetical protein